MATSNQKKTEKTEKKKKKNPEFISQNASTYCDEIFTG